VAFVSDAEPPEPVAWESYTHQFEPSTTFALPTGPPTAIPKIQLQEYPLESEDHKKERLQRLAAVKAAFEHSWSGYKQHAWLHDEVSPLSAGYKDPFGGWGATLIDSLDTLWIMGLHSDFEDAVTALSSIDFRTSSLDVLNIFETTIRYLGGLLSAHDLTNGSYPILLLKAAELGDMLYAAFDTPNRMPITRWDWKSAALSTSSSTTSTNRPPRTQLPSTHTISSELGSLSLEFTRLSLLTSDPKYFSAIHAITLALASHQNTTRIPGLWPQHLNARDTDLLASRDGTFTLGGMADSLYEYLPKMYILLGGRIPLYREMYKAAIGAAKKHLFFRPLRPGDGGEVLVSGTARVAAAGGTVRLEPQGQHLGCFAGGMVALGARALEEEEENLGVARRLVEGCVWAYDAVASGVGPELFRVMACEDQSEEVERGCEWSEEKWLEDVNRVHRPQYGEEYQQPEMRARRLVEENGLPRGFTAIDDPRYLLRPEAIESLFVLYRVAGDVELQDQAWRMFEAIQSTTKTEIGYAAVADVGAASPTKLDSCESFWMAETLKYFYLIFSEPEVVSLDEYVLNTEAHPFRRT